VHIADVSHYVELNSPIDNEAYDRATSVYLVDRVVPMLPEKLSNEVCSLRAHEDKLCFSAVFELDDNSVVKSQWFGRTIINSDKRFAYEEAQKIIETGDGETMKAEILKLNDLAIKLRNKRFSSGAISFERVEVKFNLDEKGKPLRIDTVVISTQHDEDVPYKTIKSEIIEKVIKPVCGKLIDNSTTFHVNPTGAFVRGGPYADAGLTGRKIIVDTYGGVGRHGGGAFSGKDPSKVDRSAAYAARYIAKNIVAAGLADKCEIQLAYAIGVAEPVSVFVDSFGTGKISDLELVTLVRKIFPLKPADILSTLKLRRPIYYKTASYGHFGRDDPDFTWEKTDKVELLKKELKLKK